MKMCILKYNKQQKKHFHQLFSFWPCYAFGYPDCAIDLITFITSNEIVALFLSMLLQGCKAHSCQTYGQPPPPPHKKKKKKEEEEM